MTPRNLELKGLLLLCLLRIKHQHIAPLSLGGRLKEEQSCFLIQIYNLQCGLDSQA